MQFKKIIKQQEFTDKRRQPLPDLSKASSIPYFLSNKEKKEEIVKESKIIDNEGVTELRNTNRISEDKDGKMKEIVTRVGFKEQPQLSKDERRLVGDISKLFAFEPSKPTKILVRMNQTQTNRGNLPNSPKENRLDKIEITRLDNDKYDKPSIQSPLKQSIKQNGYLGEFRSSSQVESEKEFVCQNESLIDIQHSSENLLPPPLKKLAVSKQLSIMFVPDYNYSVSLGMKNPPFLFTKFREKNFNDGINSATSNCSSDSLMVKEEPQLVDTLSTKFIKLMQIDLFEKRKEVQHARAEELRHANQKLLASHLIQKDQLDVNVQLIKKIQRQLKMRVDELQKDVQLEKEKVKQLILDLENKQKANKSLLKLNEQYLKQNNDLKHKIKDYIKNIHDLKAELTTKEKIGLENYIQTLIPVAVEKSKEAKKVAPYPPLPSFSNLPNQHYERVQPAAKKQLTFSQINDVYYVNNQVQEANPDYYYQRQDKVLTSNIMKPLEKAEGKLSNSKSQGVIRLPERVEDGKIGGMEANYDPSSRSQRNVGIKKNQQSQQPISPSTKNLVRVSKNVHNDASILLAEKLRDNKSLSSISNLSGKTLSQRVGYVVKAAPKDPKSGMLVDYMIEEQPKGMEETEKNFQQMKKQRFKLRKI